MGIVIASTLGCGRTTLIESQNGNVKFDYIPSEEFSIEKLYDSIEENDITFIDANEYVLTLLEVEGIDYDLFYPSKNRRNEFIENQVKKRSGFDSIRKLDLSWEETIESLDARSSPHCYKHKMESNGEFIGNNSTIVKYLDSVKESIQNNTQNSQKL